VKRLPRLLLLLCLAALTVLAASGCGNKQETAIQAHTEGIYIDVDELTYQIQLSRILAPEDEEDQAYLRGLAEGVDIRADEVWFAVFMRVENETEEPHRSADQFEIVDTTEQTYRPVVLDEAENVFVYRPRTLEPGEITPVLDSPSFNGPVQGDLILFRLKIATLYNRPLEFRISNTGGDTTGVIDLDV
jgi:hypothetical protein